MCWWLKPWEYTMTTSCFLNLEECREGGLRGMKISQAANLGTGLTKGIAWPAESCKRVLKRREEREKGILERMWGATGQRLHRETCWSRALRGMRESTWAELSQQKRTDGTQGRAGCPAHSLSISLRWTSVVSPLRTLVCQLPSFARFVLSVLFGTAVFLYPIPLWL